VILSCGAFQYVVEVMCFKYPEYLLHINIVSEAGFVVREFMTEDIRLQNEVETVIWQDIFFVSRLLNPAFKTTSRYFVYSRTVLVLKNEMKRRCPLGVNSPNVAPKPVP